MKRIFINIGIIPGLFTMLFLTACKEKIDPIVDELNFSRSFTPTGLTAQISKITTVTLNWTAVKNVDHYVVEIYQGTDFIPASSVYTADIAGDLTTYTYVLPAGDTQFTARLKCVSSLDGVAESKWISAGFKSDPENLFTGFKSEMTGISTCTVRWLPGSTATALVFDNGPAETSYPLTAGEIATGVKSLSSIPNGKYEIRLMNSTFVRGRTNIFLEGDVLLAAGGDLAAAIDGATSGNVILLPQGENFAFAGNKTINKSIKIRAINNQNPPTLYVTSGASTTAPMFLIDPSMILTDSIVFQNLVMTGYINNNVAEGMITGVYDQGTSNACNIGTLKFKSCVLKNFSRHLVRLRGTATQIINNIEIDGCIMYDYAFGSNYGVINSSAATGTINNIKITNSTICYIRGAIISYSNGKACQGITIKNCTFNQLAMDAATGRYLIDLNATTGTGEITISNCLFGSTSTLANGIRPNTMTMSITGSYYTSDFNDGTTFPIKSYLTAYANESTALWTDPVTTYDFHFLDTGFEGKSSAGDPRWKP